MPVHLICSSDTLFQRLIDGIFSYTRETSRLLFKNKLPLISGPRPFKFNANGHNNYLTSILCCRREKFSASQQYLDSCSTIGYLSPSRVILDSGETKRMFIFLLSHRFMNIFAQRPIKCYTSRNIAPKRTM